MRTDLDVMLDALGRLVNTESPSSDLAAVDRCATVLCEIAEEVLGSRPDVVRAQGRPHVRWSSGGDPSVLLLGHFDTVWPLGTVDRWPFAVDGDVATGPGVFDMKSGLIQGLHAAAALGGRPGIEMLFTSDEELGSPTSKQLIERQASEVSAVLVLEPSQHGALKVARKGIGIYRIDVRGRAAHAGLEPEKGANALVELARHVLEIERIARPEVGTTVTPTMASAGTAVNVVPAAAALTVDVRARTAEELERVDAHLRSLKGRLPGATITVDAAPPRPPLERRHSEALFALAEETARELGLGRLDGTEVGGASDGNLTGALGVPTLDGLGGVGDGAHAEGEWIRVSAMGERTRLVAGLLDRLTGNR